MDNRLEKFYDECWQFYRKPIGNFTKTIVRKYDKYLIANGYIKEEKQLKSHTGKVICLPSYPPPPRANSVFDKPKNIAFIHEDVGHITGGRYYAYFIISALLELGHNVTLYSNRKAVFSNEFDKYKKPNFKIVSKTASQLATAKIPKADIYIGSPIHGAMSAIKYAVRYDKPCFVLIFDPFPMMDKFMGKRSYIGWEKLVKGIRKNDVDIISLCNETSKYIFEWLNKKEDKVHPLYPCINSILFNETAEQKREHYALFISRLVKHKKFEDVVFACKKADVKLKVISSVNAIEAQRIVKKYDMQNNVEFHLRVDDKKKFEMIRQSSAVINGSIFEGFGMYVAEAITCGTPFVGYSYPTFREIADYASADNIYLARSKDKEDLAKNLILALKEKKFRKTSDLFFFERMVERLKGI